MNIDELQKRFNELRGKKWRAIAGKYPVTFTGFDAGGYGPQIFIEIEQPSCSSLLGIDPLTLSKRFHSRPLIEEISPYADWPIDARAYFWDGGLPAHKYKGHFAGLNDTGKPMMFAHGMTSFTKMGGTITFAYAELAED